MDKARLESKSLMAETIIERQPIALAHEAIHDVVEQILGKLPRGALLDVPAGEVALHINPISYSELRYTLEKYGFEILRFYRDKPKKHIWAYWPIVLLIRLLGRLTPERRRRERWTLELQSDEVLLGGNTLIVHAVKREGEEERQK